MSMAFTGIAAKMLKVGRTVHNTLKFPLHIDEQTTSLIKINSKAAQEIRKAECVIWDEITMVTIHMFNAVDRSLRFLCHSKLAFGGKVIVIGGDFKQCLPIINGVSNKETIFVNCIKSCLLWHEFHTLKLTQNI